jgi:4-amino-4-deoxy-L-arabinose transferase-like glycosyltransferase
VYLPTAARVGYNTDEGQFIATGEYFDLVFLEHQITGPAWLPNYHTLTQPMLSRFIVGAGIHFAGLSAPPLDVHYREAEVNPETRGRYLQRETYRDERRVAEERRVDRPSSALLAAARSPMVLLSAFGASLLYVIGRLLAGPIAGLVAAGVAIWNPTMLTLLPRAHAEAPLFAATLAVLLVGLLAARSVPQRRSVWLGVGCGILLGLAISIKLTAALLAASLAVYAALAFVLWAASGRSLVAAVAWRWSVLALVISLVVMVAMNPFLYPNPVGRLQDMLAFRQQEMFGQAVLSENEAIPPGLGARLPLLAERTLMDLATLNERLHAPLDVLLVVLGLLTLCYRIGRQRDAQAGLGPDALLLLCCAVMIVGLGWNIGVDWARYYLPLLTLSPVLIGIGADSLLRLVRRMASLT